jgi:peptidoglycan/xylan/chitin deacetylase (PgdA/CDA1 family)
MPAEALATTEEGPVVVISIDAETTYDDKRSITLPDQYDLKIDGVSCGITRMMETCDRHNVKATFFLDVYEYKEYGEPAVEKVAKELDARGFDVQLHTHPQWAYDAKRRRMYEYSLIEQTQIIRDGKDLLKKWLNKAPVIHRAGAYSANEDTLKALYANDIFFDSSFRFAYPLCLLQDLGLKKNYSSISNGVYQIPVNVFGLELSARGLGFMEPLRRIVKYDLDSTDSDTLLKAIEAGIENRFDVIVLFLHSFTFITEYTESRKVADLVDISEFDHVLAFLETRGIPVVTFSSYIEEFSGKQRRLDNRDAFPLVKMPMNPIVFLAKKAGIHRGNVHKTRNATITVVIVILALVYLIRRSRNV